MNAIRFAQPCVNSSEREKSDWLRYAFKLMKNIGYKSGGGNAPVRTRDANGTFACRMEEKGSR
jgi:hypothetical protein